MIIKENQTSKKEVGQMKVREYKMNADFSGALIEINGSHGKIKCLREDRIYFIIKGGGKFIIGGKKETDAKNDLIFIPKNTPYNIIGKMQYLLICSPEFKPGDDVFLK